MVHHDPGKGALTHLAEAKAFVEAACPRIVRVDKQSDGLPSVIGYSLREALNRLEKAGAEVTFSGTGFVTAQTPSPGHIPAYGTRVHLTLAQ